MLTHLCGNITWNYIIAVFSRTHYQKPVLQNGGGVGDILGITIYPRTVRYGHGASEARKASRFRRADDERIEKVIYCLSLRTPTCS